MNLDTLKENASPERQPTFFQAPSEQDIDRQSFPDKWGGAVEQPRLATQAAFENLRQVPGIINEGVKAGSDAANALFAQNTAGISSALASRAKRQFDRSMQRSNLNYQLKGYDRSRVALAHSMAERNEMYKLRKANIAGQLKFADEVANYNQAMETTKLGLLSSLIGGGMSVAGFALGGPAGAAAAKGLAGGL